MGFDATNLRSSAFICGSFSFAYKSKESFSRATMYFLQETQIFVFQTFGGRI
jgi:hypothetical protein